MSIKPQPKITYKHEVVDVEHRCTVYDGEGNVFVTHADRNLERAMSGIKHVLSIKIEKLIAEEEAPYLRSICKPCPRRGLGLLPIDDVLWHKITMSDFKNQHIGLVSQSELARIKGISRQAVNQQALRGDIEFFEFRPGQYLIPFDTVALAENFLQDRAPAVTFFKGEKTKVATRRVKGEFFTRRFKDV